MQQFYFAARNIKVTVKFIRVVVLAFRFHLFTFETLPTSTNYNHEPEGSKNHESTQQQQRLST